MDDIYAELPSVQKYLKEKQKQKDIMKEKIKDALQHEENMEVQI